MNDCKFYDAELDCCKLLSDWTEPMPLLEHCVEGICSDYKPTEKGGVQE